MEDMSWLVGLVHLVSDSNEEYKAAEHQVNLIH